MVIETTDATTGEVTEVTQNEMGLTVVYEDWDTMGNYVVYLEDAGTGDRIMEVYDSMGGVEVTIIHADGSTETTKTDEMGNMITDAYYDDMGNYIEMNILDHQKNNLIPKQHISSPTVRTENCGLNPTLA